MKHVLSEALYKHFLLLVAAFRILCSKERAVRYHNFVKRYLRKFISLMPIHYGQVLMTMNFHNLMNIADDSEIFDCNLTMISAFPFEN